MRPERVISRHQKGIRPLSRLIALLAIILAADCGVCAAAYPDSVAARESTKLPPITQQEKKAPEIVAEGLDSRPLVSGDQREITVRAFRFSGELPVPADKLVSLVSGEVGRELTFDQLNALTERVAEYLRQKGYICVTVYLPAQVIRDGAVEIAVLPGKYGRINFQGNGHIGTDRLRAMAFAIKPGDIVTLGTLERALLLMNDLSGIDVKAFLRPGEGAGIADLTIETADTAKINAMVFVDNWGKRDTGRMEYAAQVAVNNLSHSGDTLTLGGITSRQGFNGYVLGYSAPLGYDGLRFDLKHSRDRHAPLPASPDYGLTGRNITTEWKLTYPFVRQRTFSLFGALGYEVKHLLDDNPAIGMHFPRSSRLWSAGLSGDFIDSFGGGGNNRFSLVYSRGRLTISDPEALANDNGETSGDFAKAVFIYERLQRMAENLNLFVTFTGQLADRNLNADSLSIDGPDGVRAYPAGEVSGDQGYKVTGEFRWRLPGWSDDSNDCCLTFFYDYGSVMLKKRPAGEAPNRQSLMGAGLGLLWLKKPAYTVRLDYAWRIGGEAAADHGRLWLQVKRYF